MSAKPIRDVKDFIHYVEKVWKEWEMPRSVWFRGESHRPVKSKPSLRPKVFGFGREQENYLVQSFRRKSGGISNTPPFERTDLWLFLAQHHNVPTRLLDWSEGALSALFFAVNNVKEPKPVVYMLNPIALRNLACEQLFDLHKTSKDRFAEVMGIRKPDETHGSEEAKQKYKRDVKSAHKSIRRVRRSKRNFPLTYKGGSVPAMGYVNIAPAWEERGKVSGRKGITVPIPVPGTYLDARMIAQRSCFTIHGGDGSDRKMGMREILEEHTNGNSKDYLVPVVISENKADKKRIVNQLAMLGITLASIFPDLDRLGYDLTAEAKR